MPETAETSFDISVVILNYNVRDFLENALQSVKKSVHDLKVEVFVADNASSDRSVDMVRKKFPEVRIIENPDNIGFAAGNNVALRQCRGKYVLVLNPDTLIQEDTLSAMYNFMENHPDAGAASCKVLNSDGSLQLTCKRGFPSPWVAFTKISGLSAIFPKNRLFGRYNLTYLDENETHEVDAIAGSFMFVRREVFATAGLLDETYFMYGEDLDWCYRIWKSGWKIYYTPVTQIIHYKGESTTRSGFDDIRLFYEAMEVFVEKHFKKRYSLWMITLLKLSIWFRSFVAKITRSVRIAWMPLLDMVSIQSAVLLSIYLKYDYFITPEWIGTPFFFYTTILMTASFVWLTTLYFLNNYNKRILSISQSMLASVIGFFIISTISLFSKEFIFSRMVVLMTFLFGLFFTSGWRLAALFIMKKGSHRRLWTMKVFKKNTLIVGSDEQALRLRQRIQHRVDSPYNIVGLVGTGTDLVSEGDGLILGQVNDIMRLIRQYKVTEVIISSSTISNALIMSLIQTLSGQPVNVRLAPVGTEFIIGKSYISRLEPVPLFSLEPESDDPFNRFLKRGLDLSAGFAAWLLLLGPFAIQLLRLKLKRTTLYFMNQRNKTVTFRCWSLNLKEPCPLSLVWMVICGHMSLVGPPVRWRNDFEAFTGSKFPYISKRPGLISLADVMTKDSTDTDEAVQINYDFYYVNNYSFKMDIEILIRRLFRV